MREVKNIIIINDFDFINGGVSMVAISSANAMAAMGIRVIYFSAVADPERSTLSPAVEKHSTCQYDILHNPSRVKALLDGLWNRKAASLLESLLEKMDTKDTVIHLYGWIKALSPSIGKVINQSGISVVCSLQDFFAACPNGGFYNYQKNEICHLRPLSLSCICTNCDSRNYGHKIWRVARQLIQLQKGKIPGGIRHFISVTRFSENILRPYLPAAAEIYLVNNPVTYSPAGRPRVTTKTRQIIFIGRLSPEKGIELACKACRVLGLPLVIIGDGPLRPFLEKNYPEVTFRGWLSSEEIFKEMLLSAALVFPSLWYETQGIVVTEALSVGLPVIVSDACAASEFVDAGNGFTFRSGDVDDLSEKLGLILENPARLDEMSKHAYDRYWANPLLLDNYVRDTLEIYTNILIKDKRTNPLSNIPE